MPGLGHCISLGQQKMIDPYKVGRDMSPSDEWEDYDEAEQQANLADSVGENILAEPSGPWVSYTATVAYRETQVEIKTYELKHIQDLVALVEDYLYNG